MFKKVTSLQLETSIYSNETVLERRHPSSSPVMPTRFRHTLFKLLKQPILNVGWKAQEKREIDWSALPAQDKTEHGRLYSGLWYWGSSTEICKIPDPMVAWSHMSRWSALMTLPQWRTSSLRVLTPMPEWFWIMWSILSTSFLALSYDVSLFKPKVFWFNVRLGKHLQERRNLWDTQAARAASNSGRRESIWNNISCNNNG